MYLNIEALFNIETSAFARKGGLPTFVNNNRLAKFLIVKRWLFGLNHSLLLPLCYFVSLIARFLSLSILYIGMLFPQRRVALLFLSHLRHLVFEFLDYVFFEGVLDLGFLFVGPIAHVYHGC